MSEKVSVYYEATPNPQAMKFLIDRTISNETVPFNGAPEAQRSPLAHKIFGFPWASSVLLGPNFVTITKEDWVDWGTLAAPLAQLIEEHIESGQPVLLEGSPQRQNGFKADPNDSPQVQKIKEILENEVRPAVAMDGGDILFHKYEEGVVYVHMQGSCAGCPSSTMTLKMGIETRLKEALPEIVEVVSV